MNHHDVEKLCRLNDLTETLCRIGWFTTGIAVTGNPLLWAPAALAWVAWGTAGLRAEAMRRRLGVE